jgi:polysaccharide deacetylase family protein (PEP-CTERM system associated)
MTRLLEEAVRSTCSARTDGELSINRFLGENPDPRKSQDSQILNAVTIDVEDWPQSSVDPDLPITERFIFNTMRVLEFLGERNVRGTFFVLGLAAERSPELVREIHAAGHEVQCHGYGHRRITTQTPGEFRGDVERCRKLLEDIIGRQVSAYRAPAFSLTRDTLWALDILGELNFKIDSSIIPARMRRYGIAGACRYPHRIQTGGGILLECPVATLQLGRRTLPAGGGGYLRLLPAFWSATAVRQLHRDGHPAILYLHPHEWDTDETRRPMAGVPRVRRWQQGLCRSYVPGRWSRLLDQFRFGRLCDVIAHVEHAPVDSYAPSSRQLQSRH